MEGERYRGQVKLFKGSFGFVVCPQVAEQFDGRDVFLHKNDLTDIDSVVPKVGATVSFVLTRDAKGNPKGIEAQTECQAEVVAVDDVACAKVMRAALLPYRNKEVLVLREEKGGALRWSDIGGKLEPGETPLDCVLRELREEVEGFLTQGSVEALSTAVETRFADGEQEPARVTLKSVPGNLQQCVVFLVDCARINIEILKRDKPNAWGVFELRWLSHDAPELANKQARFPLLRALTALPSCVKRDRSRSRSPRRSRPAISDVGAVSVPDTS